jgi:acetylglutamate kinase
MNTICIKIGGSLLEKDSFLDELAVAISHLDTGYAPVIVHGGGKDIGRFFAALGKQSDFVQGMRVTDEESIDIVEMVLSGHVNKRIVRALIQREIQAIGLSGIDAGMFRAEKLHVDNRDIGFVGQVEQVNTAPIELLWNNGYVPVLSSISLGADGHAYNVNADCAASRLAMALGVDDCMFISDVPGVIIDRSTVHRLDRDSIESLIDEGQITGGMVPKLRSAAETVDRGVRRVHICGWNGRGTLNSELSGSPSGTVVCRPGK